MNKNYMTYGDAESIFTEYSSEIKNNAPYNVSDKIDTQAKLISVIKSVPKLKNGERPLIFLNSGFATHEEQNPSNNTNTTSVPEMDYAIINILKESVGFSATNGTVIFKVTGNDADGYFISDLQSIGGDGGTKQIAVAELEDEAATAAELTALHSQLSGDVEYASYNVKQGDIFEMEMEAQGPNNYIGFKSDAYLTVLGNGQLSWVLNRNNHLIRFYADGYTGSVVGITGAYISEMFDYGFEDAMAAISNINQNITLKFDYYIIMPSCEKRSSHSNSSRFVFIPSGSYHIYGQYDPYQRRFNITAEGRSESTAEFFVKYDISYSKDRFNNTAWSILQHNDSLAYSSGNAGIEEVIEYAMGDFHFLDVNYIPTYKRIHGSFTLTEDKEDSRVGHITDAGQPVPDGKYLFDIKLQDYYSEDGTNDYLYCEFTNIERGVTYSGICKRNKTAFNAMRLNIKEMPSGGFNGLTMDTCAITLRQQDSTFNIKDDITTIYYSIRNNSIYVSMQMQNALGYVSNYVARSDDETSLAFDILPADQTMSTTNELTKYLTTRHSLVEYTGIAVNGTKYWPINVTVNVSPMWNGSATFQILIYNPTDSDIPAGSTFYLPMNFVLDYNEP